MEGSRDDPDREGPFFGGPGDRTSPLEGAGDERPSPRFPDLAGYRIRRRIGEGGMGEVWEAEQEHPHRSVALKVIRGGAFLTEDRVHLFRREIESLGRLNHPSIAAIYDAGRTDFGQHWFAMELVDGLTLDEWMRREGKAGTPARTALRERLALFFEVCEAIQYAHQRGVIHRDLKPTNLFVIDPDHRESSGGDTSTGTGVRAARIKVLDFGLARITDADVTMTTMQTEVGRIVGTLAYMSPEQAKGNPADIDLRTDVYSLGVVLYELLTGRRPYDVQRTLVPEAVRVICEEDPARPSRHLRTLRGDLETIVMKALEKDPDRRYSSVAALAEDVRRYLANEPILARPPSTMYQVQKLVVRHKAPAAFAAVLFLVLIASTITMSVLYGNQRRERERAEAETTKAERTSQFLQDMLSSVDPSKAMGREITVREVLDEGSETIGDELADQPEVQAAIRFTIASTYNTLLHGAQARPHLDAALRTLRDHFDEDDPRVLDAKYRWAASQPDREGAEAMLLEVVEGGRRELGPDDLLVSDALRALADRWGDQKRYAEAESLMTEAVAIRERIYGTESDQVLRVLQDLGSLQKAQGDYEGARATYRRALETHRRLHGGKEDAWSATYVLRLAQSYPDDPALADSLWWDSLRRAREGIGGDAPALAAWIKDGGVRLEGRGDYAGAEALFRESAEMRYRLYGADNAQPGTSTTNVAEILHLQGRLDEAEDQYREALRCFGWGDQPHRVDIEQPDAYLVAWAMRGYAELLLETGRAEEAEARFRELVEAVGKGAGRSELRAADARFRLGNCLAALGRFAEAESLMVEAAPALKDSEGRLQHGTGVWDRGTSPFFYRRTTLKRLIDYFERRGRPAEAAAYREDLKAIATAGS